MPQNFNSFEEFYAAVRSLPENDYMSDDMVRDSYKYHYGGEIEELPEQNTSYLGDAVDALQSGAIGSVADIAQGVTLGSNNVVSDYLRDWSEDQYKTMRPESVQAMQETGFNDDFSIKDTSSLGGAGLLAAAGLGSLPAFMIPGSAAAKGLSMATKLAPWAAKAAGYGVTGGALMGGGGSNMAYEEAMNADPQLLADSKGFQDIYWALKDEAPDASHDALFEQAKEKFASEIGEAAFLPNAALGVASMGISGPLLEKVLRGAAASGRAANAGVGALTEGVQEFTESGGQRYFANQAAIDSYNPELNPTGGVIGEGLTGSVIGAGIGGTLGAITGKKRDERTEERVIDEIKETLDTQRAEQQAAQVDAEVDAAVQEAVQDTVNKGGDALDAEITSSSVKTQLDPIVAQAYGTVEDNKRRLAETIARRQKQSKLDIDSQADALDQAMGGMAFDSGSLNLPANKEVKQSKTTGPATDTDNQLSPVKDTDKATETSLKDAFKPTHELSTGERVTATEEPNVYVGADGIEIEDNYATPIKPEPQGVQINEENAQKDAEAINENDSKVSQQDAAQTIEKSSGDSPISGEAALDKEAQGGLELTGSDRAADANSDQDDLFSGVPTSNKKPSVASKPNQTPQEDYPLIKTVAEVDALNEGDIYRGDFKGTIKYLIRSGRPRGGGDSIFETLDEAKKEVALNIKWREYDERAKKEIAEREKAEAAKKSVADDIDGFLDDAKPMQRGRAIKALNKLIRINGEVDTLKSQVKKLLAAGEKTSTREENKVKPMSRTAFNRADQRTQDAHEARIKEAGKKTVYYIGGYDLGKTAYDYANYLSEKPSLKKTDFLKDEKESSRITSTGKQEGLYDKAKQQTEKPTDIKAGSKDNQPGVSTGEQGVPSAEGDKGGRSELSAGRESNAPSVHDEGQRDGVSSNTGLARQRTNGKGKRADERNVSSNQYVSGNNELDDARSDQGRVANYDLRDKPPIELTPAKRRDINKLAEAILDKPIDQLTESDKEILRQFTGSGGLDLETSAEKGAAIFNQHYTSYETIKAIYDALDKKGLAKGRALEPSVGSGNFIGMMPSLDWSAVDIDKANTDIVSRLYPEAKVSNESYETFKGSNYDLIISNVPFASFSALPRKHASTIKPLFKAIHNFFFAHSVDKLKDGGVMAFMTSTGTMDGITEAKRLRERLMKDMDVIGAYRLPMGTQKANASTEVMIDTIFLQKRPKGAEPSAEQLKKNASFIEVATEQGHKINKYFLDNRESILGDLSVGKNKTSMGKIGLIVTGEPDYTKMTLEPQQYEVKKPSVKQGNSFATIDDAMKYATENDLKFSRRTQPFYEDGILYDQRISFSEQEGGALFGRVLTGQEQSKMNDLTRIEERLNIGLVDAYKADHKKHPLKDNKLKAWAKKHLATARLNELGALFDEDFKPSEIFEKQVRFKDSGKLEVDEDSPLLDRAESLEDANGVIHTPSSDLLKKEEIDHLLDSGEYARIGETKIQNARLYYAGNIYKKIDELSRIKPAAQREKQREGLEKVLPERTRIENISIKGNEGWLPNEAIASLGSKTDYDGVETIGGNAIDDSALLSLYNRYINGDNLVKRDQKETQAEYNEKVKAAQRAINNDILPMIKQHLQDDGLTDILEDSYNRALKFFSPPVFDGSSLKDVPTTFRGKDFKLMQHQVEGAERAIYNKRGVIAFAPGLGKTPTAIIVVQQLLNKGVLKKPLFIVPANTIPQWQETVSELYPNAKVFQFPRYKTGVNKGKVKDWAAMSVADKEKMVNDLTNNRYDYTFISTNMAQNITVPKRNLEKYIDEISNEMNDMEKPDSELSKSQIKAKERRLARIAMLKETMIKAYSNAEKSGFSMGKLGFDALIADEVQYYKNIGMQSAETKGGIGANVGIKETWPKNEKGKEIKDGDPLSVKLQSSRSYDFRFKTRYISEMNNGNNVFLLTGTPTPNKPMELMTLLQHLNVDILKEYGIRSAQDFVNEFFNISEVESVGADGKNKMTPELTSIKNIEGLKAIITRYVDYRSPESAKDLKRPKQVDIKHEILRNEVAKRQFDDIQARLLASIEAAKKKRQGESVKDVEAVIAMYTAGRDASIDQRLYRPSDHSVEFSKGDIFDVETRAEYSKIAKTVELVAEQSKADKEAGQIIFLDRLKFANSNASTHEDIRDRVLKATGLRENQVVFVSGQAHVNPATGKPVKSGPKPERLQQIIDYYNAGDIKVLIGNTSKLGVGVDLQVNTTDIYQVDILYRPDEIEQRNNRGVRQGNRYDEVRVHSFSQAGTFDEMSERILANKQGFNDVFWKDQESATAEIASQDAPDAYEAAIELEKDPIKKRKLEIERDLSKAEEVERDFRNKISGYAKRIKVATTKLEAYEAAIARIDGGVQPPAYEGLDDAEKAEKLKAFKKRIAEQRKKHIKNAASTSKTITELEAEKDALQSKRDNHVKNIADIRARYVVDGQVSLSLVESNMDVGGKNKDDKLYSRGAGISGLTKSQATTELRKDKRLAKAMDKGLLEVVNSESDIPMGAELFMSSSEIQGATLNGKAYVVAEGNTKDTVNSTAWHELTHAAMSDSDFMNSEQRSKLLKRLSNQRRLNKNNKFWQDVEQRVKDADTAPEHVLDEIAGYAVTEYLNGNKNLPTGLVKWVKDFIAAIKAVIFKHTGIQFGKVSPQDLMAMTQSYVDFATKGERKVHGGTGDTVLNSIMTKFNTFFSGMGEAIDSKVGKSVNAKMLATQLQNPKLRGKWGIKEEEVEWTGIVEWLQEQDGKVTKQEINDFIEANQVQVEEVEIGSPSEGDIQALMEDELGENFSREEAIEYLKNDEGQAKYGDYTVKGEAENYRELLLTMPERNGVNFDKSKVKLERNTTSMTQGTTTIFYDGEKVMSYSDDPKLSADGSYKQRPDSHWIKVAEKLFNEGDKINNVDSVKGGYTSSHFDEKNILAHIRFDERIDADGNKVLFINEVQSDWHKEGRKRGYNNKGKGGAVPNAPFKGNAWVMLAMKRMIRHAAENGFDKVAWATGEQNVELYSLDKTLSVITYQKGIAGPDLYSVSAKDLSGRVVVLEMGKPIERIAEVLGKEMAEKIANGEGVKSKGGKEIKGDGLKVGGEGMRGFYDKTLPALVNKYIKKWGAKVGEVKMDETQHGFDVTDAMRESAMRGQPLFSRESETAQAHKIAQRNAAFDPMLKDSPNILFSKKGKVNKAKETVKEKIPDFIRDSELADDVADGFSKVWGKAKRQALGALTLGQLGDAASKVLPMINGEYMPLYRKMNVERNLWRERGGEIAKRRRDLGKEVSNRLSAIQHESTIEGVNPAEETFTSKIDRDEAMDRLKSLAILKKSNTGDGKKVQQWTEEEKQIRGDLKREIKRKSVYPKLRKMYKALPKEAQDIFNDELKYHRDHYIARHNLLVKRLEESGLSKEATRETMEKLKAMHERTLKHGVYFPLSRFGDYWLKSVDKDGELYFDMFESKRALERHIRTIEEEGYKVTGQGKFIDKERAVDGVSSSFLLAVDEMIKEQGKSDVIDKMRDELYQIYLESLPESSAQKHFVHRSNRRGFNEDQMKAFSNKVVHDSNSIAKLKYAHLMQDVLNKAEESVEASSSNSGIKNAERKLDWLVEFADNQLYNLNKSEIRKQIRSTKEGTEERDKWMQYKSWAERMSEEQADKAVSRQKAVVHSMRQIKGSEANEFASNAVSELKASHQAIMEANTHPLAAALNTLGFAWFLGLSPASAIVNLTQTPMVALPVMGSKFGWKSASKEMRDATKDFFAGGERTIKNKLRNKNEEEAYKRWRDEGLLDETISHDLSGYADAGIDSGALKHKMMGYISYMFHHAEVANREITAIGSYRAAIEAGQSHEQAMKTAEDITWKSHLDYGSGNRARFMRGNWARVLTQFKAYSQGMTHLYVDTFIKAFGNSTAEEKTEAKRALMGLLSMQFAITGAMGMPVAGMLMGTAQALNDAFGDDDEPTDVEADLRQWVKDNTSESFSRFVFKGVADAYTPLSIHGRLSLSDLWLRTSDRDLKGVAHQYDIAQALLGPSFSIAMSPIKSIDYLRDGHYDRALESMLPKVFRDVSKGVKYASDDYKTRSGYDIKEANVGEVIGQMFGFASSDMSDIWDKQTAIRNIDRKLDERRKRLIDNMANAEDGREKLKARKEIRAWNKKHPRARITAKTLRQSNAGKERRARQLNEGMYRSKRNREIWEGYDY